jgi:hypothetical protein
LLDAFGELARYQERLDILEQFQIPRMKDFLLDFTMCLLGGFPIRVLSTFRHEDVDFTVTFSTCSSNTLKLTHQLASRVGVLAYELDRLLGHIIDDDEINFSDVQTFFPDRGRN